MSNATFTGKVVKTKAFRDVAGNRFIFPSFIIDEDDEKSPSPVDIILRAMEMQVILDLKADEGWFEFNPSAFPHIRSIAASRAFAHGGATVLIFEGPEFDAALSADANSATAQPMRGEES